MGDRLDSNEAERLRLKAAVEAARAAADAAAEAYAAHIRATDRARAIRNDEVIRNAADAHNAFAATLAKLRAARVTFDAATKGRT